jgi:hypothetical protein
VGKIVKINLAFAKSSMCLVHFSSDDRDDISPRAMDGEASSPLMDDACIPVDIDMTLSVMRSIQNSSTTLSALLKSSVIQARG